MKTKLELLKERIEIYVKGKTKEEDVISFLKNAGVKFENLSHEYGYTNIRIYTDGGYVRIYKGNNSKKFNVNIFRKETIKYSGIPVFEPSGNKSF